MKGRELLPIASGLAKGRRVQDPATRSAVNRAYYAAFGEATDYAAARGFVRTAGGGSHDKLWRFIGRGIPDSDPVRTAQRRAIEGHGLLLKTRRHKADYARGSKLSRTEAADAVREADRIIKALDALVP